MGLPKMLTNIAGYWNGAIRRE